MQRFAFGSGHLTWFLRKVSPVVVGEFFGGQRFVASVTIPLVQARDRLRCWNSYKRRNTNIADTTEYRINDLARGLASTFERGGWPMVGPLISDYTWLAERITPVLAGDN
ncbi:hypothetical protein SAMN06265222_10774 [Neorhodopirellula lusitana]|uniref:Uncharacterized protein n=1 Tax=Neorhodopirellula lusitana TaxID=445327 RepID=A0ABY1Q7Q4_9BACT|nr:hypothetical protein [Neorhodopirellula lusitana]SMP61313.1 hypothetical protein SAMN06265222_10774 [Neorhodopirellula lusitana]